MEPGGTSSTGEGRKSDELVFRESDENGLPQIIHKWVKLPAYARDDFSFQVEAILRISMHTFSRNVVFPPEFRPKRQ